MLRPGRSADANILPDSTRRGYATFTPTIEMTISKVVPVQTAINMEKVNVAVLINMSHSRSPITIFQFMLKSTP